MMNKTIQKILSLSRRTKVALQILVDVGLILVCFLAAMTVRLESFEFLGRTSIWAPLAVAALGAVAAFWFAGLYKSLVRFISDRVLWIIAKGIAIYSVLLLLANAYLTAGIPRSVPIISAIFLFLAISGTRFALRAIFRIPLQVSKRAVVIYGAGEAGHELLNSLMHGREYAPIAFVDDDPKAHGLTISGLRVLPPEAIASLAENIELEAVLLAMPHISQTRRLEIFSRLEGLEIEVQTIPGLSDIISGNARITDLRNITAEDLLGRDPVEPHEELLKQNITGKVVMVTGAGGSIGSELCRQILVQKPSKLILYESSEFALYSIESELTELATRSKLQTVIVALLGSVQTANRLDMAISAFEVQTIYHAAAYKHVPLVEDNCVEGIRNNVFGTLITAQIAKEHDVENLILVSTDKAVRPTNVMGATKRIAELICQALAEKPSKTTFSIVRFGNVLGSSGSVIPRFRSQIQAGGPITVTHREINRYFMTIPEASQLVIQAGAMAKGGDVFVLDMGEPVKIVDLAETMVKLHGLKPYFIDNPDDRNPDKGDIPICFTGLRKGEKLYEELLIGNNPEPTRHPRIMTASEVNLPHDELLSILDRLMAACKAFDLVEISKIFQELPIDFRPLNEKIEDPLWAASEAAREQGRVPALRLATR